MLEVLKTIGSFLGLLTTIVYFYDRMAKGRPIGSLTLRVKDGRKLMCIRLSNPSEYDVAITGTTVNPSIYFLTETMETRELIEGQTGDGPKFMLKPREDKELILQSRVKDGVALEVKPQTVRFRVYWRRGNATWLPQWPVHVCTNTTTIRLYGLEKN
jgi:hypothetical protein